MILKWKNCIDQLDNINLLKIHKTVKNQIMMTVSEILYMGVIDSAELRLPYDLVFSF